jgi:hypothetical protein
MAEKITHWLLVALILSLGFGQLLRFEFFSYPLYLHDLLLFLSLPFFIFTHSQSVTKFKYALPLKLILLGLFIGWLRALTLFPLSSLFTPFLFTFRLLAYLAFYYLLHSSKITLSRHIFTLALITSLIIGLLQYFLMPDMRLFQYLGWDDHLNRLTLPHFDPNLTGSMLLVMTLSLWPLSLPLLFATALSLLLTYSRATWLSLILTATLSLRNKLLVLTLTVGLVVAALFLPKSFGEGTNLLRTYSITSRFEYDLKLAKAVNWNHITGIGYNNLLQYNLNPSRLVDTPQHATSFNNSFLTIFSTLGIIGLIGFLLLLRSIFQTSKHLQPLLIFLVISSLFNNLLLYPFIFLWLILSTVPTST